ncbi:50S ribosomal protein L21 [Candidatus Uhrbacteria bacterium]|nr:50S ribosomal protein L21 [Candidatus Uhrbacteria bacterium]MBD3284562.1 50S ribosomal protein L21 [Candidatus Uhrbacteria bacterium]
MFAVIKTGGKQYVVREGQKLKIEKLPGEKGGKVAFDALLLAEDDGSKVEIGTPTLKSKVTGEIVEQGKAKKIEVVKYKPKSRYTRTQGHRQAFTKVMITKI